MSDPYKEYMIYDEDDSYVFSGSIIECAEYLKMTKASFMCATSRMRKGVNKTFKNGCKAYEVEEFGV